MARKSKSETQDRPNLAVFVLIDESGSMSGFTGQTIKAVNDYIEGLTLASSPAEVSVVKFGSDRVRTIIDRRPAYELPRITGSDYSPSGGTPLCEAMGQSMERLDKIDARQKAIIVVTDGQDDGYHGGWTKDRVKAEVRARMKDGWLFLYVAANGMETEAPKFGIPAKQAVAFSQHSTEAAMMAAAMATLRFQGGGDAKDAVFTPEERAAASGKAPKQAADATF